MVWDKGFNFRASSGFVTDGTNETYVLHSDTYPVTRNGVTFGWVDPCDSRDRESGVDRRLAGINFGSNATGSIRFRVDLPAAGNYNINLAAGDTGSSQDIDCEFGDDASYSTIANNVAVTADQYIDAVGTIRSEANWPSLNQALSKSFSTTIFHVRLAGLSASAQNSVIAHLFISQVTAAGGGVGSLLGMRRNLLIRS